MMSVKSKNYASKVLAIVLMIALVFTFASCGKKTLETYVNENDEVKQEIENVGSGTGLDLTIKDNTVTYTYKYDVTYKDDQIKVMKESLEKAITRSESTFQSIISQLEKETEIDGISVVIEYINGDGSTIYSQEFK